MNEQNEPDDIQIMNDAGEAESSDVGDNEEPDGEVKTGRRNSKF